MTFRVMIADTVAPDGLRAFEQCECLEVVDRAGISADELCQEIKDYDGLVVRSRSQVNADVIEAADRLKIVGRAGIGVDNIDLDAATRAGVVVVNAPDGNATTTAEHTLSLLMSAARKIPQATASMKAGKWEKKKFMGTELCGKTLGIIGLGNIGRIVANRAQGLHMAVVGFDPFFDPAQAEKLGIQSTGLDELLKTSDFITVHTPLNDATRHLISDSQVQQMKEGVIVINCARGGIYDEGALLRGLEKGIIQGVALDVFVEEPPTENPLVNHDSVVCTPHLGASTVEAQVQVAVDIAEQFEAFAQGQPAKHAINRPRIASSELKAIEPYIPLAKKMGSFLAQVVDGAITRIELSLTGEVSSHSAAPITDAALVGILNHRLDRPVNDVNARFLAQSRGAKIIETRVNECHRTHTSALELKAVDAKGNTHSLVGTLFNSTEGRLIEINGIRLEAILEGTLVVMQNKNSPGVIGMVGTVLGQAGVNISQMHLGLKDDRALCVLNVDQAIEPKLLASLVGGDILWARQADL
jgi:D-3-phosphoglycerate dehydrogenase / 2-oxoglutarate reductase